LRAIPQPGFLHIGRHRFERIEAPPHLLNFMRIEQGWDNDQANGVKFLNLLPGQHETIV